MDLKECTEAWLEAKMQEEIAVIKRRALEDTMLSLIGIPANLDGVETAAPEGYIIKVTGRINRKVDAKLIQEIAAEHGLTEHLSTLFRWTPALDIKAWKNTSQEITRPLMDAITATPARPSFKITKEL